MIPAALIAAFALAVWGARHIRPALDPATYPLLEPSRMARLVYVFDLSLLAVIPVVALWAALTLR